MLKKTTRLLAALLLTSSISFTSHRASECVIRRSDGQATLANQPKKQPLEFSTLRQKCSCKNQCKTDMSFGIADIKYDGDTLKILEFGEGTISMFKGFDSLHGSGAMWARIWEYFSQKCPRLCLVDCDLDAPLKRAAVGYNALARCNAITCDSIDTLLRFPAFKHTVQAHEPQLVIIRHCRAINEALQEFARRYPSTIICNTAISPFVNNKNKTDQLFTGELRRYRPYSTVITKKDASKQAAAILAACPAPAFVIKPVASSRGRGVLFALRDQLEDKIKKITTLNHRNPMTFSENVEFWRDNTDTHFLVESCEASKPINIDGDEYDATLRLVYGLVHKDGFVEASAIGYYWKLPALPLNARGSFIEKKLSRIVVGNQCAAPLAPEDEAVVTATMLPILTNVYTNMLQQNEAKCVLA